MTKKIVRKYQVVYPVQGALSSEFDSLQAAYSEAKEVIDDEVDCSPAVIISWEGNMENFQIEEVGRKPYRPSVNWSKS